jgi:hypothetical protein
MAAVAERFVFGMFAGAPRDRFGEVDIHFELPNPRIAVHPNSVQN